MVLSSRDDRIGLTRLGRVVDAVPPGFEEKTEEIAYRRD